MSVTPAVDKPYSPSSSDKPSNLPSGKTILLVGLVALGVFLLLATCPHVGAAAIAVMTPILHHLAPLLHSALPVLYLGMIILLAGGLIAFYSCSNKKERKHHEHHIELQNFAVAHQGHTGRSHGHTEKTDAIKGDSTPISSTN